MAFVYSLSLVPLVLLWLLSCQWLSQLVKRVLDTTRAPSRGSAALVRAATTIVDVVGVAASVLEMALARYHGASLEEVLGEEVEDDLDDT